MVRRDLTDSGRVRGWLRPLWLSAALMLGVAEAYAQSVTEEVQAARERVGSVQSKLDELLTELRQGLSPSDAERLTRVQREWRRFANSDCAWERSVVGTGSVAPLVQANCMERQLRARIDRLKVLLCEGRGLTGACEAAERY
jgi:uncharacterized protein YecT (DUF1311 family)